MDVPERHNRTRMVRLCRYRNYFLMYHIKLLESLMKWVLKYLPQTDTALAAVEEFQKAVIKSNTKKGSPTMRTALKFFDDEIILRRPGEPSRKRTSLPYSNPYAWLLSPLRRWMG